MGHSLRRPPESMTVTITFPSRDHLKARLNGSLYGSPRIDREASSPTILDPTQGTSPMHHLKVIPKGRRVERPWA
jgi:hypothetical protein